MWPDPSVRRLAILVGVALVVTGALEVAGAARGVGNERLLLAIGGLTSIGFGIAAVAWPTVTTLVLSVVVGARLIIAAAGLVAATVGGGRSANAEPRRRWRAWTRTGVAIAGLLAAGAAAVVSVAVNRAQPDEPGAFYDAPDELPGGPGTLIRSELLDPFIDGGTAYRVLYVTSDAHGRPTTSSGLVIVPDSEPPDGGRPVLAFTHGTIGIARRCSPSLLPGDVYGPAIPGISEFLDAGFVISATDYAGLGSDAVTGYLVGASQAYSTLDGIRADDDDVRSRRQSAPVVFGESQGGHAALFTGQFAPTYAPDVELMGVAAAAPATDLESLFRENVGTTFGDVLASYALSSWADVYGVQLSEIAEPQAVPVIERLAKQCIQTQTQMLAARS